MIIEAGNTCTSAELCNFIFVLQTLLAWEPPSRGVMRSKWKDNLFVLSFKEDHF